MTLQVELSKKQKEIVFAKDGAIYVKASAGSGKTRVLTERVRFFLKKTNKKILALTFTNKAGEEIKERLSDIPKINKRIFVGTFHSFSQSVLENHGHLIGLSKMPHIFEKHTDREELIEQAIIQTPSYAAKYRKQNNKQQRNSRYSTLDFISKKKREFIDDNELEQYTSDENSVLLYRNYQDILISQNAIDFEDLLLLARKILVNYPNIAALYRRSFFAICIDEAQDLNNAQYQLLLALTSDEFTNIMMVGDPNQAIFHFNGSSPDYMNKEFVHDFKPLIAELHENYRSSKAVLSAAIKVVPETEYIAETVKEVFELNSFEDEDSEAQWIAGKIKELIELKTHSDIEGQITCEKIAILARNKYIFKQLEIQVNKNNIPFYYKMTPGAIQFESDLMKTFDLALRVRLNPQDVLHRQRLLRLLKLKLDKSADFKTIISQMPDGLNKSLIALVSGLNDDGSNIKQTVERFRNNLDIENENEKNITLHEINELLQHLRNYANKVNNKSLHQFQTEMALGKTHPLTQHSGITLSTVHTMKGLEFDIIFVMGMDDETFPDYRAVRNGGIEITQEKNNLYVAFTRARRFLYVTWPQKRMMPWGSYKVRKISRFLKTFTN